MKATLSSKSTATLSHTKRTQKPHLRHQRAPAKPPHISIFSRVYFAVIAGLIGTGMGGLFDIFLSFARALFNPQASGDFIWLLAYVLGGTGMLVGLCFGTKSGEFFAQLFNMSDETESSASSELIRIIAKALFIAMLLWGIFSIFI